MNELSLINRVAVRYLSSALLTPFKGQDLLRLKKQMEDLADNYNRIDTEEKYENLWTYLRPWIKRVNNEYRTVMRSLRDLAESDPSVKNVNRQLVIWHKKLAPWVTALAQLDLPFWEKWNSDPDLRRYWRSKLLGAASQLPEVATWLDTLLKRKKLNVGIPDDSERNMHLEGFDATLIGFDENDPEHVNALDLIKEGFRVYRAKAARMMPDLVRKKLPLVLFFNVKDILGSAGSAGDGHLDLYPLNISSVTQVVHTISHEMAHHFSIELIPHSARAFWIAAIKGDWGDLDLNDVLRAWPKGQPDWELNQTLREKDPILYLQLDALTSGYSGTLPKKLLENWSRESIEQYLAEGGNPKVRVPQTPITGYASLNPEEAFAEAVSMVVTYGPRAVHPKIRHWLQIALPGQFKEAKAC